MPSRLSEYLAAPAADVGRSFLGELYPAPPHRLLWQLVYGLKLAAVCAGFVLLALVVVVSCWLVLRLVGLCGPRKAAQ